jgi:hypothetical protein
LKYLGETINSRTKGAAPLSPSSQDFIIPNSTAAILRLNSWQSGGCPITSFTFKYKPIYQKQWILLSERVGFDKDYYYINNLKSNSEYKLLVSAHSDAGMS